VTDGQIRERRSPSLRPPLLGPQVSNMWQAIAMNFAVNGVTVATLVDGVPGPGGLGVFVGGDFNAAVLQHLRIEALPSASPASGPAVRLDAQAQAVPREDEWS